MVLWMESDARFFRRRAAEEIAAADRAVTPAARERRLQLAQAFMCRLEALELQQAEYGDVALVTDNNSRHTMRARKPQIA